MSMVVGIVLMMGDPSHVHFQHTSLATLNMCTSYSLVFKAIHVFGVVSIIGVGIV